MGGAATGLVEGLTTGANLAQNERRLRVQEQTADMALYLNGIKSVLEDPATAGSVSQMFEARGMKLDPAIVQAGQQGLDALGHLTNFVLNQGDITPDVGQAMAKNPFTAKILQGKPELMKLVAETVKAKRMGVSLKAFNDDVAQYQQANNEPDWHAAAAQVARTKPEYAQLYLGAGRDNPGLIQAVAPAEAGKQAARPQISTIVRLAETGRIHPSQAIAELEGLPGGPEAIQRSAVLQGYAAQLRAQGTVTGTAAGVQTPLPPSPVPAMGPGAPVIPAGPPVRNIGDVVPGGPAAAAPPAAGGLHFPGFEPKLNIGDFGAGGTPPEEAAGRFQVYPLGGARIPGATGEAPLPTAGSVLTSARAAERGRRNIDDYVQVASQGRYKTAAEVPPEDIGVLSSAISLMTEEERARRPETAPSIAQTEGGLATVDRRSGKATPVTGPGGEQAQPPAKGMAAIIKKVEEAERAKIGGAPAAAPKPGGRSLSDIAAGSDAAAGLKKPGAAPAGETKPVTGGVQQFEVQAPAAGMTGNAMAAAAKAEGQRLMRKYNLSPQEAVAVMRTAGWNVR